MIEELDDYIKNNRIDATDLLCKLLSEEIEKSMIEDIGIEKYEEILKLN